MFEPTEGDGAPVPVPHPQDPTEEDRERYGTPPTLVLRPRPPRTDRAALKLRTWVELRAAPYPAERHSEYMAFAHDGDDAPRTLLSAVLETPTDIEAYDAARPHRHRAELRGNRARRRGYSGRRIDPAAFAGQIHEIVHSSPTRQGRGITERFATRPPDHDFSEFAPTGDPAYDDLCVGVFDRENALAAYLLGRRVDEHVQYEEIMGHADALGDGVMWLLHRVFLEHAAASDPRPRWLHYGSWYSGASPYAPDRGLNLWKRKAGFWPAYLQLGASDVP